MSAASQALVLPYIPEPGRPSAPPMPEPPPVPPPTDDAAGSPVRAERRWDPSLIHLGVQYDALPGTDEMPIPLPPSPQKAAVAPWPQNPVPPPPPPHPQKAGGAP